MRAFLSMSLDTDLQFEQNKISKYGSIQIDVHRHALRESPPDQYPLNQGASRRQILDSPDLEIARLLPPLFSLVVD